jgi:hypothetical protein
LAKPILRKNSKNTHPVGQISVISISHAGFGPTEISLPLFSRAAARLAQTLGRENITFLLNWHFFYP